MSEDNLPVDKVMQLEKGTKSVETVTYGQKKKVVSGKAGYICTICGDFLVGKDATQTQVNKALAEHKKEKHDVQYH